MGASACLWQKRAQDKITQGVALTVKASYGSGVFTMKRFR